MLAVIGDGSFIPFYLHKVRMKLEEDEFEFSKARTRGSCIRTNQR